MNIIKILYASLIGSLTLAMIGSLCANYNPAIEKTTMINIHGYIFKLYEPNIQAQIDILHALYNILNYNADDYNQADPKDEYYKEYDTACKAVGHHTVLTWWNALNARNEDGHTIAEQQRNIFSWYGGGGPYLQRIKTVLTIAIDKGKETFTYQEFLNTLESLYTENNDYHNHLIKRMIEERDHLRSLARSNSHSTFF